MTIDTIVFDLDGTLVDTAGDLTASLNHALGILGRTPVEPAEVRQMVGQGARKLLERGLAATGGLTDELVDQGLTLFLDYYARNIAVLSRPFSGVEDALEMLAGQGFQLAVCTNKPAHLTHRLLDSLGWSSRFAAVRGADSQPYRKPDPRHLTETIDAAGGTAAIFVGDSLTDAQTAKAASVPLVLATFGYSVEPVAAMEADALIDHFDELVPAIAAIQRRFNPVPPQEVA